MTNGRKPAAIPESSEPKRTMPVRSETIALDAYEDYGGWWLRVRTNPRSGPFFELWEPFQALDMDDPKDQSRGVPLMRQMIDLVLLEWNFVDEDGEPMPLAAENLPVDLVNVVFGEVMGAVGQAPLASSSGSPSPSIPQEEPTSP